MQVWRDDQVEFLEFAIRGKQYDVKFFGVREVKAPSAESPYWELEFDDGTRMVTTDVLTLRFGKKKK
jgi:hypothetical protein